MTIIDSSVWIDHFRSSNAQLERLLADGSAMIHPHVLGELACGELHSRVKMLESLCALPTAPVALNEEILSMIDHHRLWGKGLGWIDAHLLGAARLARADVWSLDKVLARAAAALSVAYQP